MQLLLLIFVPPILLFGFALIVMRLPLPRPFPPPQSNGRNLMAAVTTGILGVGYMIGLAVYVISLFLQAGRDLDAVFAPYGLTSRGYLVFGRQYHGEVESRQVDVDFVPAQGQRPALLNVYVSAAAGTRVAIGGQKPLLDCANCQRVTVDEPTLDYLHILAQDAAWVHALLADPANVAALGRLLEEQETLGLRELYVQPHRIWLRAHPSPQATEPHIQQWLNDLLALAQAVEKGR
jgi:hypothetical protein